MNNLPFKSNSLILDSIDELLLLVPVTTMDDISDCDGFDFNAFNLVSPLLFAGAFKNN